MGVRRIEHTPGGSARHLVLEDDVLVGVDVPAWFSHQDVWKVSFRR